MKTVKDMINWDTMRLIEILKSKLIDRKTSVNINMNLVRHPWGPRMKEGMKKGGEVPDYAFELI